jgi:methionyl-tRNA formyltransferase
VSPPEPGVDAHRPGRLRVVFFGSGAFGLPILDALVDDPGVQVVAVVSAPDRPAGRGGASRTTPIAASAREAGLDILRPARLRDADAVAELRQRRPDAGVLADYGRIVPEEVLEIPARGFLNVHPSLLPRHRGASPIPAAILAGDAFAGVSIIEMTPRLDDGPIVVQRAVPLRGDERSPALEADLAMLSAALLGESLAAWAAGTLPATPQDEAAATMTRPLRRDDGRLDASRPAAELERQVRAYAPWPGSFIETPLGRLNVDAAAVVDGAPDDRPGTIVADGAGLALTTADGRLRLDAVRLAGTRRMSGAELRRGRPGLVGTVVGDAPSAAVSAERDPVPPSAG